MGGDCGTLAVGHRRHGHRELPLVGTLHGQRRRRSGDCHRAVLDEDAILLAVDRDADRQRFGVGEAFDRFADRLGVELLALLAGSRRSLLDKHAKL